MLFDPYISVVSSLLKAWQSGLAHVRSILVISFILTASAILFVLLGEIGFSNKDISNIIAGVLGVTAGLATVLVLAFQTLAEQKIRDEKFETAEERFRENPEKPQLAWDLARAKLENYLDRNLSQVRSIYWLTLVIMFPDSP